MSWLGNSTLWKCFIVIVTGLPCIYEAVKYFLQKPTSNLEKLKDDSLITSDEDKYEVLMFREDLFECRKHCHLRTECEKPNCAYKYLSKICSLISGAAESLDVCMCFITCEDLIGSMLLASRRGVHVRVIIDGDMFEFGSQVEILEKYGISMHKVKTDYKMHHKFAIIDKKLLIEGSANWTIQAFTGNWENIIITSHEPAVKRFLEIFDEIWDWQEQQKNKGK